MLIRRARSRVHMVIVFLRVLVVITILASTHEPSSMQRSITCVRTALAAARPWKFCWLRLRKWFRSQGLHAARILPQRLMAGSNTWMCREAEAVHYAKLWQGWLSTIVPETLNPKS